MSVLTLVVLATVFATMVSLGLGVASMVRDGEVGHLDSEHWMAMRVFLQLAAVVSLVGVFYAAN